MCWSWNTEDINLDEDDRKVWIPAMPRTSVGEVQFGPVCSYFCQTEDQMIQSLMKFLGLGLGPPGTFYIGLVLV